MSWRRLLVVAAAVVGCALALTGCDPAAEDVWRSMQAELADDAVIRVTLWSWGSKQETLVGDSAEAFSEAFLAGTFDMDNSECYGPTPDLGLSFLYEGCGPIQVTQWPDDRFELSTGKGQFLIWIGRAQFLISSPELTQLLRSRGYVHGQ